MEQSTQSTTTAFGKHNPVRVYYILAFMEEFALGVHASIYVLFLLSQNLNLFQVNVVNFVFMISCFLFELPTGAIADTFGRKKSLLIGYILFAFGFYIYFTSYSFVMFLVAEMIAAIGYTCLSGAREAWVADEIRQQNLTQKVDVVYSHGSILAQFAALISGVIGAYIGTVGLRLPMLFSSFVMLLTGLFVYFFLFEKFEKPRHLAENTTMKALEKTIREGVAYATLHKTIILLLIAAFFLNFAFQAPNMYWAPRFNELGGNQIWIVGWVWAAISLSMMFGGYIIKKLLQKDKNYTQISIVTIFFLGIPLFLSATSHVFSIVLVSFLLYEIGRGMYQPVQKSYVNSLLQPHVRATVFSLESMVAKLGAATGLLMLGYIANKTDIQFSWIISAILILCTIPLYLFAKRVTDK